MVNFTHKISRHGTNMLYVKTNQHVLIEFPFEKEGDDLNDSISEFYVDGNEYLGHDDLIFGLFVCIGGEIMSLHQLRMDAQLQWPKFRKEIMADARAEDSLCRELSRPSGY